MTKIVTPAVLIPRFTAFAGALRYETLPIDVSAYEEAKLYLWRGPLVGTGTTFKVEVLESTDRGDWQMVAGTSQVEPLEDREEPIDFQLSKRWFRVAVILNGTSPGVTCWLQGFFINRQP